MSACVAWAASSSAPASPSAGRPPRAAARAPAGRAPRRARGRAGRRSEVGRGRRIAPAQATASASGGAAPGPRDDLPSADPSRWPSPPARPPTTPAPPDRPPRLPRRARRPRRPGRPRRAPRALRPGRGARRRSRGAARDLGPDRGGARRARGPRRLGGRPPARRPSSACGPPRPHPARRRSPAPAGFALRAPWALWAAVAAVVLLALLAAVSLAWSATPDRSWEAFNREAAYALVLVAAVAAGSSAPRAAAPRRRAASCSSTTLVALWALAGLVAPGTWHATAHALAPARAAAGLHRPRRAARRDRRPWRSAWPRAASPGRAARLRALAAAPVLLVALGMTGSRAGVGVLVLGLAASLAAGGARLRTLATALAALAAAAAPLAVGLALARADHRRRARGRPGARRAHVRARAPGGGRRARPGRLGLAARRAAPAGRATAGRTSAAALVATAVAVAAIVAGLVALAASERGVGGSLSHASDTFTSAAPAPAHAGRDRLAATDSGGRRALWDEALGAVSDQPAGGWGAGAWPVVHAAYRTADVPARDARSSVAQVLAERGIVGAACSSRRRWRSSPRRCCACAALPPGPGRDLVAAAAGVAVAWTAGLLVASVWEVPAVTLPCSSSWPSRRPPRTPAARRRGRRPDPQTGGWRWGALAAGATLLALLATSALLPAWSRGREDTAWRLASSRGASEQDLLDAAGAARLASKLDPPAVGPNLAAAAVAQRRGRPSEARGELLEAVDEQPDSTAAWAALARLALRLADRPGALAAARRAVALDPHDPRLWRSPAPPRPRRPRPPRRRRRPGRRCPDFVVR